MLLPAEHVDPTHADLGPLQGSHLLGTDDIGRDLLVRNLSGGRISLAVGGLAMLLTIAIATLLGTLSGFFGGVVDTIVSAVTNALLSIPSILILVVFAKAFGQSIQTIVIGIALLAWPYTARIVRAVVLSVREKEFVEAAKALGTPRLRIMIRHLIPNALGPIVVSASLTIGAAILLESALSFLGVGIGQPTATWGSLLNQGYNELTANTGTGFFYSLWPGLFILVTVLSFNYIGDALRDAFDPRSLER
jgi:peptide/nickel transport system permease protein